MKNNIDISEALLNIGKFISSNEKINEFCTEQFGKAPNIYVGEMLRRQIPLKEKAPFIVLTNFNKREGLDVEWCRYRCKLVVGASFDIASSDLEADSDAEFIFLDGTKILDEYDVTNKFMNLLLQVINEYNNHNRPLSTYEVENAVPVEADGSLWVAMADLQWRIYQSMGTPYNEIF